jgi:hypothetical protein
MPSSMPRRAVAAIDVPGALPGDRTSGRLTPNSFGFTVASTSDDADQTRATVVCARILGRQDAQPFAEAGDLGTIRGAFRRNQPITQTGSLIDPVAAIARMVAKTAGYQQVDLALD